MIKFTPVLIVVLILACERGRDSNDLSSYAKTEADKSSVQINVKLTNGEESQKLDNAVLDKKNVEISCSASGGNALQGRAESLDTQGNVIIAKFQLPLAAETYKCAVNLAENDPTREWVSAKELLLAVNGSSRSVDAGEVRLILAYRAMFNVINHTFKDFHIVWGGDTHQAPQYDFVTHNSNAERKSKNIGVLDKAKFFVEFYKNNNGSMGDRIGDATVKVRGRKDAEVIIENIDGGRANVWLVPYQDTAILVASGIAW